MNCLKKTCAGSDLVSALQERTFRHRQLKIGGLPHSNLTKSLASSIYTPLARCADNLKQQIHPHPGIVRTPDPCNTDSWSISWPHQYTIPFNFGSQWRSGIQTLKRLQKLQTVWTLPTLGAKYMALHLTFLLHVCVTYSTKCYLLTLRSKLSTGATRKLNLYLRWKYRITKCLSPKDRCMEMIRRVYSTHTHTHTRARAHARTRARIERMWYLWFCIHHWLFSFPTHKPVISDTVLWLKANHIWYHNPQSIAIFCTGQLNNYLIIIKNTVTQAERPGSIRGMSRDFKPLKPKLV
jgi:hypothetical protein